MSTAYTEDKAQKAGLYAQWRCGKICYIAVNGGNYEKGLCACSLYNRICFVLLFFAAHHDQHRGGNVRYADTRSRADNTYKPCTRNKAWV